MQSLPDRADAAIEIREILRGEDASAFRTLNEQWITQYFTLEQKDRDILNDPDTAIFSKGGHIYVAYAGRAPVGCVALIPTQDGVYELSKMVVSPELRGKGIGRQLLEHTIGQARRLGARSVFLGSNHTLVAAIRLYESIGFRHVPPAELPPMPYVRADVFMTLALE